MAFTRIKRTAFSYSLLVKVIKTIVNVVLLKAENTFTMGKSHCHKGWQKQVFKYPVLEKV